MITTALNTDRILADLNALSDDLKTQAVKLGIAQVSSSGLLALKSTIPVKTGTVQKSLNRAQLTKRARSALAIPDGTQAVLVGPHRRVSGIFRSRIANILDSGADAHIILPGKSTLKLDIQYAQGLKRKATVLYDAKTKQYFGKRVNHPGTRPTQFISEADAILSGRAEQLFFTTVQQFLNRPR